MALVGPRPERPEFVEWLSKEIPYYGVRHDADRPHGLGADQIQARQHGRGCARRTPVRPLLHQERFGWSGSADHVPDPQDGSVTPRCPVGVTIKVRQCDMVWPILESRNGR